MAAGRGERMEQSREQFVEPEIVKHQEKMADVTAQVGYGVSDDSVLL
jgi:hypothetical protein